MRARLLTINAVLGTVLSWSIAVACAQQSTRASVSSPADARQEGGARRAIAGAAFASVIVETARPGAAMPIPPVIAIVIGAATVRICAS
jgi:hypothetical protein